MVQKNFNTTHYTTKHGNPNMTGTFNKLCHKLAIHSPHEVQMGRKSWYQIPNLVDRGWEMMDKLVARGGGGDADEIDTEDNEGRAALDDVVMELL